MDAVRLKRGLLAFWALYLSVVVVTISFDALKALGMLGADWKFAELLMASLATLLVVVLVPERAA